MDFNNIILIALAAIFALGFSFFQYLFRTKKSKQDKYVLFTLRALTLFVLLLLLINPKITSISYEVEKPNLILAADNSASISYLNQADTLKDLIREIETNDRIQDRFSISSLSFGSDIQLNDSLNFKEPQTDVNSVLSRIQDLFRNKTSAVILLTDGNQTLGRDFRYFKSRTNQVVMPVVLGDTTTYSDIEISQLNVNRYAFLDNRFPVEVIVNYNGDEAVSTGFEIRSGETVIYKEEINLDPQNRSQIIETTLPASRLGVLTYEAAVLPLDSEKNKENNRRKFAVEIIDERTRVLLLTDISHPDLGSIKKSVESNRQRELDIKFPEDDFVLQDYQLVMLYQPNSRFSEVLEEIKLEKINSFIITGTKTDWRFLNSNQDLFKKDFTSQPQEIQAVVNPDFTNFQFDDIGFNDFPPLQDLFGEIEDSSLNPVFYQKIENVETVQPLLAIAESDGTKTGVLFGEGIWQWRAQAWREKESFESFDDFLSKIIQNLATQQKREHLSLDYESFYYGNDKIQFRARFFDENYTFDPGASLIMRLENSEGENIFEGGFVLKDNSYVLDIENLPEGEYDFILREENTGIAKTGSFNIIASDVEIQFSSANLEKLQFFANNNNEQVYFADNSEALISRLLNDENFIPVQKSHQKTVPLINWYYLLFLLVALLAAEWFFRKYRGLI
ncbi:MAG TPA: hypothetical protein VLO29_00830 [Salegentibacter sp.]|nr:hypothetical protein [Salegentibacter sp.]